MGYRVDVLKMGNCRVGTLAAPEKMRLVEGETAPDISAFWVGTRHRSSMACLIETFAGRVAVTDCCFKHGKL